MPYLTYDISDLSGPAADSSAVERAPTYVVYQHVPNCTRRSVPKLYNGRTDVMLEVYQAVPRRCKYRGVPSERRLAAKLTGSGWDGPRQYVGLGAACRMAVSACWMAGLCRGPLPPSADRSMASSLLILQTLRRTDADCSNVLDIWNHMSN